MPFLRLTSTKIIAFHICVHVNDVIGSLGEGTAFRNQARPRSGRTRGAWPPSGAHALVRPALSQEAKSS